MADTSVAAATEQERWVGGADGDSDGLQESYGDDDDNDDDDGDDDDDDDDDKCGGGGVARSRKQAESTAGNTSPLPQTFELNEIS